MAAASSVLPINPMRPCTASTATAISASPPATGELPISL